MRSSLAIAGGLLLCSALVAAQNLTACVSPNFNANTDCFTTKVQPTYAKFFSVNYFNYYKVVTVSNGGAYPLNYTLVIRGAPTTNVPTNTNATFFIPVNKAATMDTTSVPFVMMLGQQGTVVAADSEDYISTECWQRLQTQGSIAAVNDANATQATSTLAPAEVIFAGYAPSIPGLNASKIVLQSATSDPGALNRMEWLEFFGQWWGLDGLSSAIVLDIATRYNATKAAAKRVNPTPLRVAWTSYNAPASWNGNQPSWSFSTAQYKKDYTADAGATLVAPSTLTFTDANALKAQLMNVDVMIDESFTGASFSDVVGNYQVNDSFPFVANKQIYREDARINSQGYLDWFESAIVFPNQVLLDLVQIVNPKAAPNGATRRFLRKVATENPTTVTSSQCVGDPLVALMVPGPTANVFAALPATPAPSSATSLAGRAGLYAAAAAFAATFAIILA